MALFPLDPLYRKTGDTFPRFPSRKTPQEFSQHPKNRDFGGFLGTSFPAGSAGTTIRAAALPEAPPARLFRELNPDFIPGEAKTRGKNRGGAGKEGKKGMDGRDEHSRSGNWGWIQTKACDRAWTPFKGLLLHGSRLEVLLLFPAHKSRWKSPDPAGMGLLRGLGSL